MFRRPQIPALAIAFVSNWLFIFLVWLNWSFVWILSANFSEKSLCPDLLIRLALIVLAADKSLFLVHLLPKLATGNPLSHYSTRSVLFPADDSSCSAFGCSKSKSIQPVQISSSLTFAAVFTTSC